MSTAYDWQPLFELFNQRLVGRRFGPAMDVVQVRIARNEQKEDACSTSLVYAGLEPLLLASRRKCNGLFGAVLPYPGCNNLVFHSNYIRYSKSCFIGQEGGTICILGKSDLL